MLINVSTNNKKIYFSRSFISYDTTHKVVKAENGIIVLRPVKGDGGDIPIETLSWILTDGIWNDDGDWKDEDYWEDYGTLRNVMLLDGATDMYIPNSGSIESFEIGLDYYHDSLLSKNIIVKGSKTTSETTNQFKISTQAGSTIGHSILNITIGGSFTGVTQVPEYFINQDNWNRLVCSVFKKSSTVYAYKVVLNDITVINKDITTNGYTDITKNFELFCASGTFGRFNKKVANFYFKDLRINKTYNFDLTSITANEIKSIQDTNFKIVKTVGTPVFNNETNYFYGIDKKPDSENISYIEPDNRYVLNPFTNSTNYSVPEIAKEYFNPKRHFKIEFDMFIDLYNTSSFYDYNLLSKTNSAGSSSSGFYRELNIYFNTVSNFYVAINTTYSYSVNLNVLDKLYLGEWNHFSFEIEYKTNTTVEFKAYINNQFIYTNTITKSAYQEEKNNFKFSNKYLGYEYIQPLNKRIANIKYYDFDINTSGEKYRLDENDNYFYSDKSYKKRISANPVGTKNISLIPNPFKPKLAKEIVLIEPEYRNVCKFTNNDAQRATLNKEFFDLNNNFRISGSFYLKTTSKTLQTIITNISGNLNYFDVYKNGSSFYVNFKGKNQIISSSELIFGNWNTFSVEIIRLTTTTSTLTVVLNGFTHIFTITHNTSSLYNLLLGQAQQTGYAFEDRMMNFKFEDLANNTSLTFRLDEEDNVNSYRCPENVNAIIYKTYTSSTLITTENILNPLFV